MSDFPSDRRGSAVRWFALAAAGLCIVSLAGVHALDWLSQSGRVAMVASRAPAPTANQRVAGDPGVDSMPTGSIPSTSALIIRFR